MTQHPSRRIEADLPKVPPPRNYLADDMRRIARLHPTEMVGALHDLAERVETLAATPVEVDASTELTASFGLSVEQECRAQAAAAIGWQHPSDTDLPDYHAWWWAELGRLAAWIRDGTRPAGDEPACTCEPHPTRSYITVGALDCPEHGAPA